MKFFQIQMFSFKKMHLKMLFAKGQAVCLRLSVFIYHGCRWPGDKRSQRISSHDIDPISKEDSSHSTKRVKSQTDMISLNISS